MSDFYSILRMYFQQPSFTIYDRDKKDRNLLELLTNYERNNPDSFDVNYRYPDGETILILAMRILAAEEGIPSVVEWLLNQPNINVNIADNRGTTPLHIACFKKNEDIVSILLERNDIVSINSQTNDGFTPLILAAISRNYFIVEMILDYPLFVFDGTENIILDNPGINQDIKDLIISKRRMKLYKQTNKAAITYPNIKRERIGGMKSKKRKKKKSKNSKKMYTKK